MPPPVERFLHESDHNGLLTPLVSRVLPCHLREPSSEILLIPRELLYRKLTLLILGDANGTIVATLGEGLKEPGAANGLHIEDDTGGASYTYGPGP